MHREQQARADRGEFFEGIKQWEMEWKGNKAKLPVFYRDTTSISAIYTASSQKVRPLLPHPDMRLVELYPGKCLVAFTGFEYRDTDIAPYNEVAISFLITFRVPSIPGVTAVLQTARRSVSGYIWQLPVTTEIARSGGVELYGFPKFLADIRFERSPGTIRCDLSEGGTKILSIEGKVLPTKRGKLAQVRTYSVLEGIPLVANVLQNPLEIAESRAGDAARVDFSSEHEIARTLRTLELSADPITYQYSPVNQAILFAGRNVIDS